MGRSDIEQGEFTNDEKTWERYWRGVLEGTVSEPPWNWDVAEAAPPFHAARAAYFGADLPLIDLGCGDGLLTRHLARDFRSVVGVDVAEAALERARRLNPAPNVDYEKLDITDVAGARALHDRIGDAHVHLRGVLHAIEERDRPTALAAVAELAGARGRVFDIEMSPRLDEAQREVMARFGTLPASMAAVGASGLRARRMSLAELAGLYAAAGFEVLMTGETVGRSAMELPDGSHFGYPMVYLVAGREPGSGADGRAGAVG
ncbi:class I SAM-dependent methyltransferase [Kitasatospora sp. NPDC002227]|uniref:class I SAM-dependent methyltransferase n=1 Tax=Kitasatospora sp. NPDC002227 TaxID=3154773 RepID=UPI0033242EBD